MIKIKISFLIIFIISIKNALFIKVVDKIDLRSHLPGFRQAGMLSGRQAQKFIKQPCYVLKKKSCA